MELRVEAADDSRLPPGCVVSVRIGDVLKQGRYEASRCYHFPGSDRRRNAKVDLYQHIGSCVVGVDPETKSMHEVTVTSADAAFPAVDLKVHFQAKGGELAKEKRDEQVKAMKSQAKDYLTKHRIDEKLSEAVKQLLKSKPEDPTEFLIQHLRATQVHQRAEDARQTLQTTEAAEPPAGPAVQLPDAVATLRQKALEGLTRASRDGQLQRILEGENSKPQTTADAPAAAPRAVAGPPAVAQAEVAAEEAGLPDPTALRHQAAGLLADACLNGELLQILQEHSAAKCSKAQPEEAKPVAVAALIEQARDGLRRASNSGELQKLLQAQPEEAKPVPITALVEQAREGLRRASNSGELQQMLQEVRAASQAGVDASPGMMLPSATLQGPAFAGMGMTPGLVFV